MYLHLSRWFDSYLMPRLTDDDGTGGGTGGTGPAGPGGGASGATGSTGATGASGPAPITFTAEQEAEINRRAAAARKEGERAAEQAIKDANDAAEKKRKDDIEVERGNFIPVREGLEKERDGFKTERDAIQARFDTVIAQLKPGVDADWAAFPAELKAAYQGADDDVVAKSEYLRLMKPAWDGLKGQSPTGPRLPMTPRPNGGTGASGPTNQDEERERAARSRRIG